MDFAIKRFDIGERLMGQMVRLEIAPDNLDVIEFKGVFGQPLDGEPVLARIERRQCDFADMDRPIILDQHDGSCQAPGSGAKEAISCSRCAMKSALRLVRLVWTMSRRVR